MEVECRDQGNGHPIPEGHRCAHEHPEREEPVHQVEIIGGGGLCEGGRQRERLEQVEQHTMIAAGKLVAKLGLEEPGCDKTSKRGNWMI